MAERSKWQMVAWAVAAALLVLAAVRVVGGGGGSPEAPPVRVDGAGGAGAAGGGPGGGAASSGESLYVHVAGEVRRPGLLRLPKGSRLAVALERAGGPTRRAELAAVNLAQPLEDGQQVIVPRAGTAGIAGPAATPGAEGPAGGAAAAGAPTLSLATATLEQLDQLDGIGPTLAQRILDYRDENGGFRSVDELQEVEGIGEKRFASLKEAVRP